MLRTPSPVVGRGRHFRVTLWLSLYRLLLIPFKKRRPRSASAGYREGVPRLFSPSKMSSRAPYDTTARCGRRRGAISRGSLSVSDLDKSRKLWRGRVPSRLPGVPKVAGSEARYSKGRAPSSWLAPFRSWFFVSRANPAESRFGQYLGVATVKVGPSGKSGGGAGGAVAAVEARSVETVWRLSRSTTAPSNDGRKAEATGWSDRRPWCLRGGPAPGWTLIISGHTE